LFAETTSTFEFNLKTPLSTISLILNARTEGGAFNATCRVHSISPNTLREWEEKFGDIKDALFLYSLVSDHLTKIVEGDELYTKVKKNVDPSESEGWTIVLMDRATRFIWDMSCSKKTEKLFLKAIKKLAKIIKKDKDITHVTDGERRYSATFLQYVTNYSRLAKKVDQKRYLAVG